MMTLALERSQDQVEFERLLQKILFFDTRSIYSDTRVLNTK